MDLLWPSCHVIQFSVKALKDTAGFIVSSATITYLPKDGMLLSNISTSANVRTLQLDSIKIP